MYLKNIGTIEIAKIESNTVTFELRPTVIESQFDMAEGHHHEGLNLTIRDLQSGIGMHALVCEPQSRRFMLIEHLNDGVKDKDGLLRSRATRVEKWFAEWSAPKRPRNMRWKDGGVTMAERAYNEMFSIEDFINHVVIKDAERVRRDSHRRMTCGCRWHAFKDGSGIGYDPCHVHRQMFDKEKAEFYETAPSGTIND